MNSQAPAPLLPATDRTLVMGVLNVTPDSFFDGGDHLAVERAVTHAQRLVAEGADLIDVGGEYSRPGAEPVPVAEGLRRVLPVIEPLSATGRVVSIDTCHAETARQALQAGATVVNDITALRGDPEMAGVIADAGCSCVLMHMLGTPQTMQQNPQYNDVVGEVTQYLQRFIDLR